MNTKKTVLAVSAGVMLATAVSVFADPPHRGADYGYRNQHRSSATIERRYRPVAREVVVRRPLTRQAIVAPPVYVQRQPTVVYQEPAYYSAPPVYGASPAYYAPAGNGVGIVGGAILGAAIGSQIGHGNDRMAATAIGAFVGGMIGSGW